MKTFSTLFLGLILSAFAAPPSADHHAALGPMFNSAPHQTASPRHGPRAGLDAVRRWNEIAINASGLDHTPVAPGELRVFGEQLGPCRAARAMAITCSFMRAPDGRRFGSLIMPHS